MIPTVFVTSLWLFILKNYKNVPAKSSKQKTFTNMSHIKKIFLVPARKLLQVLGAQNYTSTFLKFWNFLPSNVICMTIFFVRGRKAVSKSMVKKKAHFLAVNLILKDSYICGQAGKPLRVPGAEKHTSSHQLRPQPKVEIILRKSIL